MKKKKMILLMFAIGLISLTSINSCTDDGDVPDCPDTYIWDYETGTCVKVGQTGVY